MKNFNSSPREMFASFYRNKDLIFASVKREFLGKYRGSAIGIFWAFLTPLFMLTVYTFVFSVVFQSRWGGEGESKTEFALVLFCGLMMFTLFADAINRAPTLILSNANFVKKIVYPLEILPVVSLINSVIHLLISCLIWIFVYIAFYGVPKITVLFFPLILIPFIFFTLGVSWILCSLGVFIRDVSQLIAAFTSVLLFLSPIFYPVSILPEKYQFILYMNPLTTVVETSRDFLFWGRLPDTLNILLFWALSVIVACIGFAWFQKTRKGFSDVI